MAKGKISKVNHSVTKGLFMMRKIKYNRVPMFVKSKNQKGTFNYWATGNYLGLCG